MPSIHQVTERLKAQVLRHLYEDKFLNAYVINRLENEVRNCITYVSRNTNGVQIDGYLSNFETIDAIDVWVRGKTNQRVNDLLSRVLTEIPNGQSNGPRQRKKLYVSTDPQNVSVIREKFPNGKTNFENAMIVRRGEEKLSISFPVEKISENVALEYTRFLAPEDYTLSNELIETNRGFLRAGLAYGAFNDKGKLQSTANALIKLPYVWVIAGVETLPQYRKRGLATSIVSTILKEAFRSTDTVMLFVNNDNLEAIRVYEKLGFRKFADFLELQDFLQV